MGCGRYATPAAPEPEPPKINARVLVYMPDEFVNYHYTYDAILKRYDYYFKDLAIISFPQLIANAFVKADFTYEQVALTDDYDFLIVPKFISANLFTDKLMGNDLLIDIQVTFTSKNNPQKIVIKGTGKSSDDGVAAETPYLGSTAFTNALQNLKKNILEKRSFLEN